MTRNPEQDRRRAGARSRALAELARRFPVTYRRLYEAELVNWCPTPASTRAASAGGVGRSAAVGAPINGGER